MTIGRLVIHTVRARIDFSTANAQIDLHQTLPGYDMVRHRGDLRFIERAPELVVDSSRCRAEEGLKSVSELTRDAAQEGMENVRRFASRMAAEGREMLKYGYFDKHLIGKIAFRNAVPEPKQSVLTFIPSQPPEIRFTDPVFRIEGQPDILEFSWNVSTTAEIRQVRSSKVDIRMAQYPSIEIEYVENTSALDIRA